MKRSLLLAAASLFVIVSALATTYTVGVGGMSFSPSSLTVHPGDVITWTWTDGTHTTTSVSVPGGATSWNANINSSNTTFSYTPTVLGTYQYQCTFHASMGMVGTITVVSPTGIAPINANPVFNMYPNPSSDRVHILLNDSREPATITLTNILGMQLVAENYDATKAVDLALAEIPAGTYFVNVIQGNKANKQELIVIH